MKLYRGIQSKEYIEHSIELDEQFKTAWRKILTQREIGNFTYPEELNNLIIKLYKNQPLTRQYFTDNVEVAERYLKVGGLVIELDVPIEDILDNFIIEFQNYSKRKEKFEVTYLTHSKVILENKLKWKMKVQ